MLVISCDSLFATSSGVFLETDYVPLEREEHLKVIVIYDYRSKSLFAHCVPKKGPDEEGYSVECFVHGIMWLGCARVIVRSDNELAIVRLVKDVLAASKVNGLYRAQAEGFVPYHPQSNGAAEVAARVHKGQLRTLQLGLETHLSARILVGHPATTWLTRHSGHCRTLRVRGTDGLTADQRIECRNTAWPKLMGFGEQCRFKLRAQEHDEGTSARMWHLGIWIGIDLTQNCAIYVLGLNCSTTCANLCESSRPRQMEA